MSSIENQTEEDIEPLTPFNFDESAHKVEESQLTQKEDRFQRKLWRWHLKLNHPSFPKIIFMALQSRLPKRLKHTFFPNLCI